VVKTSTTDSVVTQRLVA